MLVAKAGATFASPFVGRLDDIAEDGMALISSIIQIYKNYNFPTQVLVASVRHPVHFVRAAELGAHVATCPFNVLQQIMKHPLTDIGLERFLADYHKATQRRPNLKTRARLPGLRPTARSPHDRAQSMLFRWS